MSSHLRAILYALTGFTFWVLGDTFMKLAGETAMPKYEIMSIGGAGGMIMIGLWCLLRGETRKLRPRHYRGLALIALFFFLAYGCWQFGFAHLPLANFYVVIFLAPMAVSVIATFLLKEKPGWKVLAATVCGFIGVVIAVDPEHLLDNPNERLGYAAAFGGMIVLIGQQLALRFMASRETRECCAFYPRLGAIVGGLVLALVHGFAPVPFKGLVYSLATGALGGMGWMAMAEAYKHAPTSTIVPFHYSQIVTGALVGYIVWQTMPTPHMMVGGAIIIACGLYVVRHTRKPAPPVENV